MTFGAPNVGEGFDAEVTKARKAKARRANRARKRRAGGRDRRKRAIGH